MSRATMMVSGVLRISFPVPFISSISRKMAWALPSLFRISKACSNVVVLTDVRRRTSGQPVLVDTGCTVVCNGHILHLCHCLFETQRLMLVVIR